MFAKTFASGDALLRRRLPQHTSRTNGRVLGPPVNVARLSYRLWLLKSTWLKVEVRPQLLLWALTAIGVEKATWLGHNVTSVTSFPYLVKSTLQHRRSFDALIPGLGDDSALKVNPNSPVSV